MGKYDPLAGHMDAPAQGGHGLGIRSRAPVALFVNAGLFLHQTQATDASFDGTCRHTAKQSLPIILCPVD